MAISHIIRGEEFISSTPRYAVTYDLLGWESPVMIHVPLVLGPNRAKLSKRHGDTTLMEYAEKGYLPEALVNFLVLLGWSPGEDIEFLTQEELIARFTIDRFQKHSAIFNLEKLDWMNGEYIRHLPPEDLAKRILPWLTEAGMLPALPSEEQWSYLLSLIPLVQERIKLLGDAPQQLGFFLKDAVDYDPAAVEKRLKTPEAPAVLEAVANALDSVKDFSDASAVEETVRAAGESVGVTGGKLIHPVRVAITGKQTGPGLFEAMSAVGRERCQQRLRDAAKLAE
jgi:glutamyl-tRNA synthetase